MRILFLAALAGLAGCSSQPQTVATSSSARPVSERPIPEQAGAAPAAAAMASASEEPRKFKPPQGFKTQEKDGTTLYCRKQVVLGSRFPHEYCLTQAQLKDLEASNEAMRVDKEQRARVCGTSGFLGACGGQ